MLWTALLQAQPIYETHWTSASDPDFSSGTAGSVTTRTLDLTCGQIGLSVTDPVNAPLPAFNAYQLNPVDTAGNPVTDLSGNLRIYTRVRSRDSVRLALLLRSGGGSSSERSDRVEFVVPGDTASWTELMFVFNASNVAGFDSTDLLDLWFYLDRGDENFAGNGFYFDYLSIGAPPAADSLSPCFPEAMPLYLLHWDGPSDATFTGSGGNALTQVLDTACSQLAVSVTDPVGAPLPAFSALILNPQLPAGGGDLTDLSGHMSFHLRVRSRDSVTLGLLLRAADGSAAFRTSRLEQVVPGDTASWTELTYTFDSLSLGGFDSTDLRDIWLYLDPGEDNFAGNDFVFDYFAIGMAPGPETFSLCPVDTTTDPVDTTDAVQYAVHFDRSSDPLFSGSAAAALTQTIDTACSQLFLSVTDPATTPWNGTSPIIVNPLDTAGNDIADLSGSMQFHLRVRSRDSVELALQLRSGDGSSAFRTSRISQTVAGDTLSWTELTFTFDAGTLGGFDSTDLRDIWLFLDYGTDNFAGNAFWVDYFAFGEKPAASTHSACSLFPPFAFPWVLHWADSTDGILGGSESVKYTQTIDTACSQLGISVTDPVGDPHLAFKPIVLNPLDGFGNDLSDLSGQMRFLVRVRSEEAVELAMLLRSGDGGTGSRTEIVRQMVPAGLDQWTELTYTFTGPDLGGFDSTDLRDVWFFLDRDEANFPGNAFYFDYISIGSAPPAEDNSTCVLSVSNEAPFATAGVQIYPNPLVSGQPLNLRLNAGIPGVLDLSLLDGQGRQLARTQRPYRSGSQELRWALPALARGLYLLRLTSDGGQQTLKLRID